MTTQLSSVIDVKNLYNRDYYLWLIHTAQLIKAGNFGEIDAANLIEEIEDMGRSEKRGIKSNLIILLLHLLKYKYQPEKRTNRRTRLARLPRQREMSVWKASIREYRRRLRDDFKVSPSLKRYFQEVFAESYQDSREQAADETGLSIDTFPDLCPFTIDEVLDSNYLPPETI